MDPLSNVTLKTPIEVALAVDEDGYTTASAVYQWLELSPSNYARWCQTNIVENPFFEDGYDYYGILHNEEWGGQATTDYRVTSEMAKMLCMTSKSERAVTAYRYYLKTEDALKRTIRQGITEINALKAELTELRGRQTEAETRIGVIETGTIAYRPSKWVDFIMKRIALLAEHYVHGNTNLPYTFKDMFHHIMDELGPEFNDELHETERIYEYNTGNTDGHQRPIQMIDYNKDLRKKFNDYVNRQLYDMEVIDEDEDRENDTAMLRKLFPPIVLEV